MKRKQDLGSQNEETSFIQRGLLMVEIVHVD